MAFHLPSYSAYKSSSVDWFGDVPAHWKVVPNRSIFVEVIEKNYPDEQMLSVTITRGVIQQQELLKDESKKDSSKLDKSGYKLVLPGDIAYNKMRAWQGAIGISEFRGIVSPAYIVQRPRKGLDRRFLHYLFRTPMFAKEAERWSYGIASDMWSLRPQHFKMIYACVPPLPEQRAIVRYLDHVDRHIQRYIEAKEQLVALLQEARQAIIQRAVTHGLNPDVPLKPSDIDWLGDVPAHWEVVQLGRIGRFSKGSGGTKADEVPEGVPCIRYGDLYTSHRFHIHASRSCVSETDALNYTPLRYGDILFAGSGETIEEIGKSAVNLIEQSACCGGDVILFRPERDLDAVFSGYAFDCPQSQYQKSTMGRGFTVMHIYGSELKYLWIALPPLAEQRAIVMHLDQVTAAIDSAIDNARRQSERMAEYRASLIAHIVTGKLDVRAAAERTRMELAQL